MRAANTASTDCDRRINTNRHALYSTMSAAIVMHAMLRRRHKRLLSSRGCLLLLVVTVVTSCLPMICQNPALKMKTMKLRQKRMIQTKCAQNILFMNPSVVKFGQEAPAVLTIRSCHKSSRRKQPSSVDNNILKAMQCSTAFFYGHILLLLCLWAYANQLLTPSPAAAAITVYMLFRQVLETLVRIKRHDPALYEKDTVIFPQQQQSDDADAEAAADGKGGSSKQSSKPVYLRTVLAQQALAAGDTADADDDGDDDNGDVIPRAPVSSSYASEQAALKAAFLAAAQEVEQDTTAAADAEEVGGLVKKIKTAAAEEGAAAGKRSDIEQDVNKVGI